MYRLAIKRRFWFGYEWFDAIGHQTEVLGGSTRLVIQKADGTTLSIPLIDRRRVIAYPIRKTYQQHQEAYPHGAVQPG